MPNYNDVHEVAELLAGFDFAILGEQQGETSPQHLKYTCEFRKNGCETLTTAYESNPYYHDTPTAADVFSALLSDAQAAQDTSLDDFAEEFGFTKPSQAIRAYESCQKTLNWLKDGVMLSRSDRAELSQTLEGHAGEVGEEVDRIQTAAKADYEREHPAVPQGFTSIEDLQADLDLGDYGSEITGYSGNIGDAFTEIADSAVSIYSYDLLKWLPDNREWLEEAEANGLLEGCKGDIDKMVQAAQYECFSQDLYDHQEDIAKYAALEGLKDAGVYALNDAVYADVFGDIDFDDNNLDIEDLTDQARDGIQDAMAAELMKGHEDFEDTLEDALEGGYDFPNPCAMGKDAVRTVNGKGYETAFREFWKDCEKPAPKPSISEVAKETRASAAGLDSNDHGEPGKAEAKTDR